MDVPAITGSGGTGLPANSAMLTSQILTAAAARDPHAVALYDGGGHCTYAHLAHEAERFTEWLLDRGIGRGHRIAVDAIADRKFASMLYGTLAAGAVFVPISLALTTPERTHQIADAEPTLVVSSQPSSEEYSSVTLSVTEIWNQLREPLGPAKVFTIDPADGALLIYTSGSSSRPKGVLCLHSQIAFAVRAVGERLGYRASDVVFTRLPLSFDYGLYQLFLCAAAGAAIAFPSTQADARLLAEMAMVRATIVPLVPTLADMLILLSRGKPVIGSVRLFTNTGERLEPGQIAALRDRFPGAAVQLMYGLTECKRVSIGEPDGDIERPGSVGRPLNGTTIRVVDSRGAEQPAYAVGEVLVTGPHVMKGYWRAPIPTSRAFRAANDGSITLHTGDWGSVDEDGYLYLAGRQDDQFKSRGVRTSVHEIEAAAIGIPGVRRAVLVRPCEETEATLCVSSDLSPQLILRQLRERLESAKVPRRCRVLESFPIGRNGKIDRTALAQLVRS